MHIHAHSYARAYMRLLAHTCTVAPVPRPQMLPHPLRTNGRIHCGSATPTRLWTRTTHLITSPVSAALWAAGPTSAAASPILCARSTGVPASSRSAAAAILRAMTSPVSSAAATF
eukprot:GHVU01026591.1.p2 GENE.GHVU01026591.1~~GHVU01026591.1.p2  ORF type:complete len:115 (-),score=5.01 GHVU01026591.1:18-362(-)